MLSASMSPFASGYQPINAIPLCLEKVSKLQILY